MRLLVHSVGPLGRGEPDRLRLAFLEVTLGRSDLPERIDTPGRRASCWSC